MCGDREIVLAAVRNDDATPLQYASEAIRDDHEIVLAAVKHNGRILQSASEAMRGDREIVLAAQ